jgi:uncharacterized protein (DUF58 family)
MPSVSPRDALLTPELLRELDKRKFVPQNRVEGRHSGRHKSPLRGSSTEFRDYREYTPGDDPARVDWRVFARNDRHVIRTYEQEAQTGCVVVQDRSASMDFGNTVTKHRYASRLAACLCHIVVHSQDRAGLYGIAGSKADWFPPAGNARNLDGMIHNLNTSPPGGQADLSDSLHKLQGLLTASSTLVLLSDFYCPPGDLFKALNPFLHRSFDIHLLHILDPLERDLPEGMMIKFRDLESSSELKSDPKSLRERYRKELENHIRGYRELAIRRGVHHQVVYTDQPVFTALSGLTA